MRDVTSAASGRSFRLTGVGAFRRRNRQLDPQGVAAGAVLTLLAVLVGVPVVMVIWMSFRRGLPGRASPITLENYANLASDPYFLETIGNTVVFAGLTLLVTFTFLIPLTFLLTRCDLPFRRGFVILLSIVILIPTFLRAIGWILLFSPEIGVVNRMLMGIFQLPTAPFSIYSMAGMALIQGLGFVPAGYFMLSAAYRAMDPVLEEAAYTSGLGKLRTFLKVNVPLTMPALLGTFVYLAMTAVSVFEAPAIIGIPARIYTVSSIIALRVQPTTGLPDYGEAGAYGMIMLMLGLVLSWVYFRTVRQSRKYVVVSGKGYRPKTIKLGKWKPFALAFVMLFFLAETFMPLGMLLWASFTPYLMVPSVGAIPLLSFSNYSRLGEVLNPRVLANTGILVVLAPVMAVVLSVLAAWVVTRSQSRLRGAIDILAFLPHAVPHILFAVGLAYLALLTRQSVPLYGSVFLIVLAHGITYMAFGSRALNSAMIQIHRDLEEAGRVAGLTAFGTLRKVVVPLISAALFSSWFWIALLSYREVTMALILYAQTNDVLSTLIWNWWREGRTGEVAALGSLLVSGLVLLMSVVLVGFRQLLSARESTAQGVLGH